MMVPPWPFVGLFEVPQTGTEVCPTKRTKLYSRKTTGAERSFATQEWLHPNPFLKADTTLHESFS